ncbi:MAG: diguanylate cyclase [Halobacteriovoraceae bacterium]|nr:diguanylate cyclase [Halobacteriovoraceae bacterium]|tara:strand:- start:230019 stop:230474 length:456 start_codon:yes stop_codon:yes gene_type:complete
MKADRYKTIIKILDSLYMEESNLMANLSNTAAVIKEYLGFFWVGFYLVDKDSNQLIVGPYQGPLACGRIDYGKGVCGSSWKEAKTLVVKDVHDFPGHISCSPLSQSEIVVPIIKDGKVMAVLDIDDDKKGTFDNEDKKYLERICEEMAKLF